MARRPRAVLVKEVNAPPKLPGIATSSVGVFVHAVIPEGTLVADGQSFTIGGNMGGLKVVQIIFDVPRGVTATLSINGQTHLASTDGDGLSVAQDVGSFDGKAYFDVAKAVVTGTNSSGASRNVRCLLTSVVPSE